MKEEQRRCAEELNLPSPDKWNRSDYEKFLSWMYIQEHKERKKWKDDYKAKFELSGGRGLEGPRSMNVLGNHRRYERENETEKRMCAIEMGLKDPSEWTENEWNIFVNWRNVLHGHDIVSGSDTEGVQREKEKRAEQSRNWLMEYRNQYDFKKKDNAVEDKEITNNKSDNSVMEKEINIPEGWEVKRIDGTKIVIGEKEKEEDRLPKTWDECLNIFEEFEIINMDSEVIKIYNKSYVSYGKEDYKMLPVGLGEPILALSQLLICRNAWWKELNWTPAANGRETTYCIVNHSGRVVKRIYEGTVRVLSFPTAEVRDKFLKTFKDLIEKAKDLL